MRHRKAGRKLGRSSGQRRALYRNLVTELFRHGRIKTTEAKAKSIRPKTEKLITLGKSDTLHARRLVTSRLNDPEVVKKLFDEIAPRYQERKGGYTRILRLGPRQGDNAPMVLIELVE